MKRDIHKHRCGLHLGPFEGRDERLDPPLAEPGCGFEWEHERIFLNTHDYAQRHACPRCGKGPWYRRVLTPLQEQRMAESAIVTLQSARDVPELTRLAGFIFDTLGFDEKRFEVIGKRLTELTGRR